MHLMEQPLTPAKNLSGKMCSILTAKRAIPEPPYSENAGFARSGESYGVDWSPRFGAKCPKCGVYTKASYKHLPWTGNRKTRYHLCPQCAFRFKSVAEDIKLGVEPTALQLRYLRKYGK